MKLVADTSALFSVLVQEPGYENHQHLLLSAEQTLISVATQVELHIVVLNRRGSEGLEKVRELLRHSRFASIPVDTEQMQVAQAAFQQFGKGHHPAALNFGDLFSYALAKTRNLPLLFKGNDFAQTDIEPALKA